MQRWSTPFVIICLLACVLSPWNVEAAAGNTHKPTASSRKGSRSAGSPSDSALLQKSPSDPALLHKSLSNPDIKHTMAEFEKQAQFLKDLAKEMKKQLTEHKGDYESARRASKAIAALKRPEVVSVGVELAEDQKFVVIVSFYKPEYRGVASEAVKRDAATVLHQVLASHPQVKVIVRQSTKVCLVCIVVVFLSLLCFSRVIIDWFVCILCFFFFQPVTVRTFGSRALSMSSAGQRRRNSALARAGARNPPDKISGCKLCQVLFLSLSLPCPFYPCILFLISGSAPMQLCG